MKKRILTFLLALVMCLGLLPAAAFASSTTIVEAITFTGKDYVGVLDFSDGLAAVELTSTKQIQDIKVGFIDESGKLVITPKFHYYSTTSSASTTSNHEFHGEFHDGYAVVCSALNKWGIIDETGKVIVPLKYWHVSNFSDGIAYVHDGKKSYYYDTTGKLLSFSGDSGFSEGLAPAVRDGRRVYIDTNNNVVIDARGYSNLGDFHEGFAKVKKDGKWGFIDKTGKLVVPCAYDEVEDFQNGMALVVKDRKSQKWGFVNTSGKEVVPCQYETTAGNINQFSEGVATLKRDGKWYIVDENGKESAPLSYNYVGSFNNGLAVVSQTTGGGYGYINKSGTLVIPCKYAMAHDFQEGVAAVRENSEEGCYGFIDTTGREISGFDYRFLGGRSNSYGFQEGLLRAEKPDGTVVYLALRVSAQAAPTNDKLTADGKVQDATVYKIDGSNYFKIRDLAAILNGSGKQFEVGYDGETKSVTADTGKAYTANGTELKGAPAGGVKTAAASNDTIYINGVKADVEVYKIDGSNYFKLRDLGKALNFYVGWTKESGMFIDTSKPYSE